MVFGRFHNVAPNAPEMASFSILCLKVRSFWYIWLLWGIMRSPWKIQKTSNSNLEVRHMDQHLFILLLWCSWKGYFSMLMTNWMELLVKVTTVIWDIVCWSIDFCYTWIPSLAHVHPKSILLDLAKHCFSIIWRSSKKKNFPKIWRLWLKNCARHAHFNFELLKGVAVSFFKLYPSNFSHACIFYRQTNDVFTAKLYL